MAAERSIENRVDIIQGAVSELVICDGRVLPNDQLFPVRAEFAMSRDRIATLSATVRLREGLERVGQRVRGDVPVCPAVSVLGWQKDVVYLCDGGGALGGYHCFGALPGDGLDAWLFWVVDSEAVGYCVGLDYSQSKLEVRGTRSGGPLLRSIVALVGERLEDSPRWL
ncbi:MAG: hypothetical protein KC561_01075 [Myxococcales bacterium]|nr:hypothetical protein [Myxococcales bacterium]